VAVQFNGKARGGVIVTPEATEEEVVAAVRAGKLAKYLTSTPEKVFYVPGRIINFVL
jgi:leucyl-tRNA synthetase